MNEIERLTQQNSELAQALGRICVAAGVLRPDAPCTGPELLHIAASTEEQVRRLVDMTAEWPEYVSTETPMLGHDYTEDTSTGACAVCGIPAWQPKAPSGDVGADVAANALRRNVYGMLAQHTGNVTRAGTLAAFIAVRVEAAKAEALREFAQFVVAPVHEGLDDYTLRQVALEAEKRAASYVTQSNSL